MADSIRWFDTVDSTNTRLLAEQAGLPDRTVYAALFQTAGRGQKGNRWESRPGENLTFSILLKPAQLSAREQFILSQVVALGLTDYLAEQGVEATIKWPNDIYVGDSKIAGILIENDLQGASVSRSIIGCGVNVNQASFHFPTLAPTAIDGEKHAPTPVSLFQLLGHTTERRFVLEAIMDHFMHHYADLQRGAFDKIHAAYRAALYRSSGLHPFRDAAGPFTASIEGVEPTGHLLLRDTAGRLRRYAFKEVSFC